MLGSIFVGNSDLIGQYIAPAEPMATAPCLAQYEHDSHLGNPCQVARPPSVKDPAAFATKVATEAVEAVKSAVSVKNASTSGVFSTSIMISFHEYPGRYPENFFMEQPQASTLCLLLSIIWISIMGRGNFDR